MKRILALILLFAFVACAKEAAPPQLGDKMGMDDPMLPSNGMEPGNPNPMPPGPMMPQEAPCASEMQFFEDEVWAPILSLRCVGCHNVAGTAKDTRMVLDYDNRLASYHAVKAMALEDLAGTSLLLLKPTLLHPQGHTGGLQVNPESNQYAALEEFVAQAKTSECDGEPQQPMSDCTEIKPGKRQLRRLTGREYDNTIRDLLGLESDWGDNFVADIVVNGFDNNAEALTVSDLLGDQVSQAATALAEDTTLSTVLPCQTQDEVCAREFVRTFGEKAYRRPITNTDLNRYVLLFRLAEDFESGIRLIITAMLQSPYFLYRSELGMHVQDGIYALTPYEIATQLSYFLTESMPDDALLTAARNDELRTQEQIEAQARRLLTNERSKATLHRFIEQWLHLEQLMTVPKDSVTYPEFTTEIRAAMLKETHAFIDHVVSDGSGKLSELFNADYSFVNGELSAFYGLTPPMGSEEFNRIDLTDGHRAGLLTQGSFVATHARPNSSSPIHRGLIVRERILCQDLPPPPPGVDANPPVVDPSLSTRERYRAHSEVQPCVDCHRLIDPIGFAFEHFDGIGRVRDNDFGHTIDASGEIVDSKRSDAAFNGVAELGAHLAQSLDAADCFALQSFRYAYGAEENNELECLVTDLQTKFKAGELEIKSLFVALATSPHITTRLGDPQGQTEPEPEPEPIPEPDPPANSTLQVQINTDSDWGAGYCNNVTVTNQDSTASDWLIEIDIDGTISTHWNAEASGTMGRVQFGGVHWNNLLDPGASASFGYCANR